MIADQISSLLTSKNISHTLSGKYFKVRCINPDHEDNHPSMSINASNGYFRCWSCGYKGSFSRLCYLLDANPVTYGVREWREPAYSHNDSQEPEPIKIESGSFESIYSEPAALHYLRERGVSDTFIDDFDIVYCRNVGLNGSTYYNRIAIPAYLDDKLLNIELRAYQPENNYKKVLYPPRSSTNFLFNWDNLDLSQPVILTEGLMDLPGFYGITKNVCSFWGCSWTDKKQSFLNQIPDLIIAPDNDEAGFNMVMEIEKHITHDYKVLILPNHKKDPGECSSYELEEYLTKRTVPAMQYMMTKMGIATTGDNTW